MPTYTHGNIIILNNTHIYIIALHIGLYDLLHTCGIISDRQKKRLISPVIDIEKFQKLCLLPYFRNVEQHFKKKDP